MPNMLRSFAIVLFIFLCILLLPGCKSREDNSNTTHEKILLNIWAHAGQEPERKVLEQQVARFNLNYPSTKLQLTFIPERDYNAQIQAAAIAGDLPDILEFDGPYLYNYIWQGHLLPLEELLSRSLVADLLPSIIDQGTHGNHLYAVGIFDSGLGLYARKDLIAAINAQIPRSASEAWSVEEFENILRELARLDEDGAVLDIKLNYGGEWFTYGFSPILQSAGADLIDRTGYQHSTGTLNSPAAVEALQRVQDWVNRGYVDPNLDDAAFTSGRTALSWVGHWEYNRYSQTYRDSLAVVPLPDFGRGSRTGQGSWNWGITRNCRYPEKAAAFLTFLLNTPEVLAMCTANSAVPGTRTAVGRSELFSENGPLRLFAEQLLSGFSVARPKTPAYPVITTEFQKAFQHIRNNGDVQQALDRAAANIDQDISDNHGYPFRKDQ